MKNLNILKVRWKIQLLGGGGGSRKTNIEEGGLPKGGGGLGKKEGGGVFEGVLVPQCTLWYFKLTIPD